MGIGPKRPFVVNYKTIMSYTKSEGKFALSEMDKKYMAFMIDEASLVSTICNIDKREINIDNIFSRDEKTESLTDRTLLHWKKVGKSANVLLNYYVKGPNFEKSSVQTASYAVTDSKSR